MPDRCQLYLISPLDVAGAFPQRLENALAAGPVAAFQFRVKGRDQHEAARLAAPLQAICLARDVAFIVNDSIALANRRKDPLFLFASLQRQLGYPEVPRPQPGEAAELRLPQMARRLEQLETRLKLVEEEQRGGIDLTKFYVKPDQPPT